AMYGTRLDARIVTVRTRDEMSAIRKKLEAGESFETVVTTTPNVQVRGDVKPESAAPEQEIQKQLKVAAFATKEHTLSNPVMQSTPNGELFHAVWVEKVIPKDASAKLTDPATKAKVEKAVKAAKEQRWMAAMAQNLHQNLHVEVKDPTLSRQY